MRKSIKSGKIMVMTERFEVYKYNGGKKKKNNSDIRGKKKTFRFGRDMPEVMPEIAKTCVQVLPKLDKGRKEQEEQFWWG